MLQWIWFAVLVVNLATLAVYAWDKWRSTKQGARRVSERTLLWLLFLCGWPAAWLAMSWFRHKTRKASFRRFAILWTVLNPFWPLAWWTAQELLTPAGS